VPSRHRWRRPALAQEAPAALRDLARRPPSTSFRSTRCTRTRWQATVNEANPQRPAAEPLPPPAGARRPSRAGRDDAQPRPPLFVGLARSLGRAAVPHRAAGRRSLLQLCLPHLFPNTSAMSATASMAAAAADISWAEVDATRAEVNALDARRPTRCGDGRILVDRPEELDRLRIRKARVLLETPDMRIRATHPGNPRADAPAAPGAARVGGDWRRPTATIRSTCSRWARGAGESPLAERDRCGVREPGPLRLRPPQVRPCAPSGRPTARVAAGSSRAMPIRAAAGRPADNRRAGPTASAISAISATTILIVRRPHSPAWGRSSKAKPST